MINSSFQSPGEFGEFQQFPDPETRAMIAECGFRVAEYIAQEDIGTVVLVDKSARNLYIPILEAQRQATPDQETGIYFLNPAGFLSPEVHDAADYTNRTIQQVSEDTGLSTRVLMWHAQDDRRYRLRLESDAHLDMASDKREGGRVAVAAGLTPLLDEAVKRDERFNGRVLVLDACRHYGGSQNGITAALKDVGVLDVRTGVVNNIGNETDYKPDFVVFEDDEIRDICRPFGPQDGLMKGACGFVSTIGEDGLSSDSRVARRELHRIMKDAPQLRSDFQEYAERHRANRRIFGGGTPLSRLVTQFFSEINSATDYRETEDGMIVVEYLDTDRQANQ